MNSEVMQTGEVPPRQGRRTITNSMLSAGLSMIATAITVLSQISSDNLTVIYGILWLAVTVVALECTHGCIPLNRFQLFFLCDYTAIAIYCFICCFVTGETGYITGHFMAINKVALMYNVGVLLSAQRVTREQMQLILRTYICFAVVYGVWVMIRYLPSYTQWLSNEEYLFASKNSFGQIAGVAAICALIENPKRRIGNLAKWSTYGYLLIMIAMCQCRTALLGLIISTILYLLIRRKPKVVIIVVVICGLTTSLSTDVQRFFLHVMLMDKYSGASADTFSSGRFSLWSQAINDFLKSPGFGLGSYYVDDFYLNSLVNLGLIGSIGVFALIAARFVTNVHYGLDKEKRLKYYNTIRMIAVCLIPFYLVESILEGLPPIGPGACSFVFWILCGYLDIHWGYESSNVLPRFPF